MIIRSALPARLAYGLALLVANPAAPQARNANAAKSLSVAPPHISSDQFVRYDYDIVYVRAPRFGDERQTNWAEFSDPTRMERGADLMLLHPDGREEVLVSGE